ncbi:F-box/kelch-repeat protein [Ananas comosus]|uniref:F-box/kelch-repeat protein n=1 Tax=Ananas comosus TaxID=4615 RepID=A0A199VXT7_ANACO|nr:F-box/kelch-repeat protein [Ananas comosus]
MPMAESCHSRGFSWLVKSCIPDPRHHISPTLTPPPPPPPPRNPTTNPGPPSDRDPSPIAALPTTSSSPASPRAALLPPLPPLVSRRFSRLLLSPSFLPSAAPSATSAPPSSPSPSPSPQRLPLLRLPPLITASPPRFLVRLLPPPSPAPPLLLLLLLLLLLPRPRRRPRPLRLPHRPRRLPPPRPPHRLPLPARPTLFPRRRFAAAAVAGKIYVAGGSARARAVEEYDPAADAWRVVAEAPRRRYGCVGAAAAGVFYVAGGLGVGGDALDARACAGSVDAFLVGAGAWVRPRPSAGAAAAVPGGGCVVGACGAGEHVYVVASHAVELSFWRWEGVGRGRRGGWTRLEPPPVPGRFRLGGALRFSCAAVGADKVAALVHVAAVRGGAGAADATAAVADAADGAVLVYDIPSGEWTRGPDLPPGFRRAACVGVEY